MNLVPPNIGLKVRRLWHSQRGLRNGRGGRYKRMPSKRDIRKWIASRIIAEVLGEAAA